MTVKIAHVVFSLIIVAASGFWNVAPEIWPRIRSLWDDIVRPDVHWV
jgi:hypothetical protein